VAREPNVFGHSAFPRTWHEVHVMRINKQNTGVLVPNPVRSTSPWSALRRSLKDPWLVISILITLLAVILIIIPQYRIFVSSTEQAKGKFCVKTSVDGALETVHDANKGFTAIDDTGRLVIKRDNTPLFALQSLDERTLALHAIGGEKTEAEILDDGKVHLWGKGFDVALSQEVLGRSIFQAAVKPAPLQVVKLGTNEVAITYHTGAFLNFFEIEHTHGLSNYREFFTNNRYVSAIKNSLVVAMSSSLLAGILAISLAYLFARYHFPGKGAMVALITMASVSPPFLGGYAWRMLLGSQGILTRALSLDFTIVGLHGVIWVITWLIFPLIFLLTYDSFTAIDNSLIESSMSLGANKSTTLFKVIIPLAMPGIVTGIYLGMMTAFSDFGTPYVISLNLNVLPVMVYQQYMNEVGSNFPIASTGSVIMILISSAMLMAQRTYLATKAYASISARTLDLMEPPRRQKILIMGFAALLIFVGFIPHLTVTLTSFFQWRSGVVSPLFTLENYVRMVRSELNSIYVSFFLGFTTTLLNVVFGVAIAYIVVRKRYPVISDLLNTIVMIPYIIPGTVLAIGFIMIFNQPPILITGTWLILVLAYFARKLPYSVKTAEAVLYQIHPDLEEAAKSLGAKPTRSFFDITFKLVIGGVISGATLSFLQVMTEISSTIILYRPPWKPMTAVIFENTTRAGSDFGVASAMTVVLMLCLYTPLYFITKRTRMDSKEGNSLAAYY
jgi:iron(III) transport system permease protein